MPQGAQAIAQQKAKAAIQVARASTDAATGSSLGGLSANSADPIVAAPSALPLGSSESSAPSLQVSSGTKSC